MADAQFRVTADAQPQAMAGDVRLRAMVVVATPRRLAVMLADRRTAAEDHMVVEVDRMAAVAVVDMGGSP